MSLFLITVDEDGDVRVDKVTEGELLDGLAAEPGQGNPNYRFLSNLNVRDPMYWTSEAGGNTLLIRGEIVVPQPKEQVTKWELPQ